MPGELVTLVAHFAPGQVYLKLWGTPKYIFSRTHQSRESARRAGHIGISDASVAHLAIYAAGLEDLDCQL